jgi:hypothetical protein
MNPTSLYRRQIRVLALVVLALVQGGCGGNDADESAEATETTKSTAKKRPQVKPAGGATGDAAIDDDRLGNAVIVGKSVAPIMLKYDIPTKPQVGTPFEVSLIFLTRQAADALEADVTGMSGLTIASGGQPRFEGVTAAGRYVAKVLVNADADGLYYIGIVARAVSKVQTETRTFSVPVVVGTAPVSREKPAPATDAAGEAIESTPAKETVSERPTG